LTFSILSNPKIFLLDQVFLKSQIYFNFDKNNFAIFF